MLCWLSGFFIFPLRLTDLRQNFGGEKQDRRDVRSDTIEIKRHTFVTQNRLQDADGKSIIFTPEAEDIYFWAHFQSWTFCDACGKLEPRKPLPGFRRRNPSPLTQSCKCSTAIYKVPVADDIPLILRNLTEDDLRVLRPLTIHCGAYERRFNR